MIAGAGFNTYSYRLGFDISIPMYSPIAKLAEVYSIDLER